MLIRNYKDKNDLYFNFGQFPKEDNSILVTSNYDTVSKKLLQKGENLQNSFALLYYVIDGSVYSNKSPNEAEQNKNNVTYANNLLFDRNKKNDSQIKKILEEEINKNKTPFAYIVLAQYYFNAKNINWGLKFLEENKDSILKDKKLESIYNYTYEQGKALAHILGR